MKTKIKTSSSWLPLYVIAGAGCAVVFAEKLLSLRPLEHHLVLIFTLVGMFWVMQQWLNANRFKMTAGHQPGDGDGKSISRVQSHYRLVVMSENPLSDITIQRDTVNTL